MTYEELETREIEVSDQVVAKPISLVYDDQGFGYLLVLTERLKPLLLREGVLGGFVVHAYYEEDDRTCSVTT